MGKQIHPTWIGIGIPLAGAIFLALFVLVAAVGCSSETTSVGVTATLPMDQGARITGSPTDDLLKAAAAEATAIVMKAQASAIVLQAQAEATELAQQAASVGQPEAISATQIPDTELFSTRTTQSVLTPTRVMVEIISVGIAAEGGYIHVQFHAPVGLARRWNQGMISLTDEGTGAVYAQIPVLPKVGALIGKPMREGQPGYVMLVNGPVPLQPGARVTVVLGDHKEEHLIVGP